MAGQDQRRFPRVNFQSSISVTFGDEKKSARVDIVDLTVEGIAFSMRQVLPVGTGLFVNFPGYGGIRKNEVPAQVVRCMNLDDPGGAKFKVAARYLSINDQYLMDALHIVHRGGSVEGNGEDGEKHDSLLEEIGGLPALERVHGKLLDKLETHPWLKQFFNGVDRSRLMGQLNLFMAHCMGGPVNTAGMTTPMKAHKHLFITPEIFEIRHLLLQETLIDEDIRREKIIRWLRVDQAFEQSLVKKRPEDCMKRSAAEEVVVIAKPGS